MTAQLAPAATGLASKLRVGTQETHQRAESQTFMARLVKGDLVRADLRNLTAQLLPVYEALEDAARGLAEDPVFGGVHDPALNRLPALRADLEALSEPGEEVPVLPAARAYAERIRSVANSAPAMLAHHYTRYLGDLSGGQALGAIFSRSLGLTSGLPGISFYHFADIAKVKPYKDNYRVQLDTAPLTEAEQDIVVAEAKVAFELNQALFRELQELSEQVAA